MSIFLFKNKISHIIDSFELINNLIRVNFKLNFAITEAEFIQNESYIRIWNCQVDFSFLALRCPLKN